MTQDPASDPASTPIPWPPESGPGSDREAWVAFAREVARGNEEAWEVVDEQSAVIASLEAEVARLRARLAEREPPVPGPAAPEAAEPEAGEGKARGGSRRITEDTRAAILADLAAGLSQREAAARHGVSAMTVSRLARGV